MNINDKDPQNLLVKALLVVAFSAVTTAALSNENWIKVFRNFIAGICAGVVIYIILTSAGVNKTWVLIGCSVISAFVSSLWPMVESIAKKYLKKKTNDVL